jgi:hypothetical protein
MRLPALSPGTVSKILWHFTGGPRWSEKLKKQGPKPKPSKKAYDLLKRILRSRSLHVGGYREIIRRQAPKRGVNKPDASYRHPFDSMDERESARVCCLADIPIQHLAYHAQRYGRFAIGFHRAAVLSHDFNPVLYAPEQSCVIEDLYSGLAGVDEMLINQVDPKSLENLAGRLSKISDKLESAANELDSHANGKIRQLAKRLQRLARGASKACKEADISTGLAYDAENSTLRAKVGLERAIAFVKTFKHDEFGTIYCEREWRSMEPYDFDLEDLAMIVLPKSVGRTNYFEDFVTKQVKKLGIPSSVPVVPWEDLINY